MDEVLPADFGESLFSSVPLLHDQLIKPFENTFRAVVSPMQFYTLAALYRRGPMTMTELAEYFAMPKQQMAKIINRLTELNAVERTNDLTDKRIIRIRASTGNDSCLEQFREIICGRINRSAASLPTEERTALLDALKTIHRVLPDLSLREYGPSREK